MPKTTTQRDPGAKPRLWTAADVAEYLVDISEKTLANWRSLGQGPPFLKVGTGVRYRPAAVEAWAEEQERNRSAA